MLKELSNAMRRIFIVAVLVLFPARVQAELAPDELAIIAVKKSAASRELAEYYAKARKVPASHICLIDVEPGKHLARNDWENQVRPTIRAWLVEQRLEEQVRCFVTVWDTPLKIGKVDLDQPRIVEVRENLHKQRLRRQEQIMRLIAEIGAVMPAEPPELPVRLPQDASVQAYSEALSRALTDAQVRLRDARQGDPAELQRATKRLEKLFFQSGGVAALVRVLQTQVDAQKNVPKENKSLSDLLRAFEFRRGELGGMRTVAGAFTGLPESVERDTQIAGVLQQTDGPVGVLNWIEAQESLWNKNETYASFDSELALIHFPEYGLLRWQNSPLHFGFALGGREGLPQTCMVARLEAPTIEQARRLVDDALAKEKSGLEGKFYIDARGIQGDRGPGSYGDYDQSLIDLAKFVKDQTSLEVVLDEKNELFAPESCPDAALYCGWYSLANYVDAFTWKPGAVAYHIASGEAATLRGPESNVWCKRMLEKGVCATLGPVEEPYLQSFPRPLEFFALLLSGRYTLAETYAATSPFLSWQQVLVGDPLYNPYRGRSAFDVQKAPEAVKRVFQALEK
jgi:uncharacterized protein (TIGR03790 family)